MKQFNEYAYGNALGNRVSFDVFRNEGIRGSLVSEMGRGIPSYLAGRGYVYIIPFCSFMSTQVDHIVYMDSEFKVYREGGADPFPYNLHRIGSTVHRVYIAPSWECFFSYMQGRVNKVVPFGSVVLVLDRQVQKGKWVERLRGRELIVLDNGDKASLDYVRGYLAVNKLKYAVEQVIEKKRVVEKKVSADVYLGKHALIAELKKLGIETTYDTIRKVIRFFDVPSAGETWSLAFFKSYYLNKQAGMSRQDACDSALKEYLKP